LDESDKGLTLRVETPESRITLDIVPRTFTIFWLTDIELDTLLAGYNSINATFLGVSIGAAIALLLAFFTTEISNRWFGAFVMLVALSLGSTAYFMSRYIVERRKAARLAERIRTRPPIPKVE